MPDAQPTEREIKIEELPPTLPSAVKADDLSPPTLIPPGPLDVALSQVIGSSDINATYGAGAKRPFPGAFSEGDLHELLHATAAAGALDGLLSPQDEVRIKDVIERRRAANETIGEAGNSEVVEPDNGTSNL